MTSSTDFDVCIIGGGPGGLAALSAFIEPYSVDQLARNQSGRAAEAYKRGKSDCPRVCVVDPEPWLTTWHRRFKALDIKWLRSPVGAHPDLFDKHSLLAHAVNHDRKHDMMDSGVVSQELRGLPEASSGLYNLPSNKLFEDFCEDLASRLPHTFVRAKAASVQGDDGDFSVCLMDGRKLNAKTVVLALGVPGPAAVPPALADVPTSLMFHSDFELGSRFKELRARQHVLVIGGGLTAVQAAQLALKKGCRVMLVSRRPLTTRHFDVGEDWFDHRHANRHHYEFFQKPVEERLRSIKATRGGGSVPPMYMKGIRESEARGELVLKCGEVQLHAVLPKSVDVTVDGKVQRFDKIVNACGHRPDCHQLPLIHELLKTSPVDTFGGLPTLSQHLQWGDFEQLFVIGALASLQVGPDAGNLMGLRRAAQIIANVMGVRSWLKNTSSVLSNIRGNRYDALQSDSDSEESEDSESEANAALSGDPSKEKCDSDSGASTAPS